MASEVFLLLIVSATATCAMPRVPEKSEQTFCGSVFVDVNSLRVREIASFVTSTINRSGKYGVFYEGRVVSAEMAPSFGAYYRLVMKFSGTNGNWTCNVTVVDQPWTLTRNVTSLNCLPLPTVSTSAPDQQATTAKHPSNPEIHSNNHLPLTTQSTQNFPPHLMLDNLTELQNKESTTVPLSNSSDAFALASNATAASTATATTNPAAIATATIIFAVNNTDASTTTASATTGRAETGIVTSKIEPEEISDKSIVASTQSEAATAAPSKAVKTHNVTATAMKSGLVSLLLPSKAELTSNSNSVAASTEPAEEFAFPVEATTTTVTFQQHPADDFNPIASNWSGRLLQNTVLQEITNFTAKSVSSTNSAHLTLIPNVSVYSQVLAAIMTFHTAIF